MDSALSISFSTAALLAQRSAQPRPLNTSIRRPGQHGRHQSATVPRAGRGRPLANRAADHKSDATPGRASHNAAPCHASHNGAADRNGAPDRESDAAPGRRADDGSALSTTDDCPADRQSDAAARGTTDDIAAALSAPDDGAADRESHAAAGRTADDAAPDDQADGQRNNKTDAAPRTNSQADAEDARPDPTPDGPFRWSPPDRRDHTAGRQALDDRRGSCCT